MMTAKELQEQVKRTFDDEGCDEATRARIAIQWIVDWLVEQEAVKVFAITAWMCADEGDDAHQAAYRERELLRLTLKR